MRSIVCPPFHSGDAALFRPPITLNNGDNPLRLSCSISDIALPDSPSFATSYTPLRNPEQPCTTLRFRRPENLRPRPSLTRPCDDKRNPRKQKLACKLKVVGAVKEAGSLSPTPPTPLTPHITRLDYLQAVKPSSLTTTRPPSTRRLGISPNPPDIHETGREQAPQHLLPRRRSAE